MENFNYCDNALFCEQLPLTQLAREFGTPLYVYSQKALTDAYHTYKKGFANISPLICYAVKANGNLSILKYFASLGAGFDIVSAGELARVIAAGGSPQKTIFSGVGKTVTEIEYALTHNILCFNVESVNELHRISDVACKMNKSASISLRVNPDVDAKTHPYISTGLKENKFGIAYQDALATYLIAQSLPGLEIVGIDCHIGSQLLQLAPLIEAFDKLITLVDALLEHKIHVKHIDMGGGIGIQYEQDDSIPDLSVYAQALSEKLTARNLELILEPGRSLVGNSGVLLTQVEYIKHSQDKNFVVVDAAMNDLIRPSLYSAYHEIVPVRIIDVPAITADVVGPICETSDFLGKDRVLCTEEGGLLAVKNTGAYAASMASNYNTRVRAAEVLVSAERSTVIRQRETIKQLLENELIAGGSQEKETL